MMKNKIDLKVLENKLNKMNHLRKYILIFLLFFLGVSIIYYGVDIIKNLKDKQDIIKEEKKIFEIVEVIEIDDEVGNVVNPPEERIGLYWEFINYKMIDVDINSLKQKNSDTMGWLVVNGTNINYPIVQSSDNDFYLNHQFDKTYNSAGWVFMDYRNSKNMNDNKNTIIYGHGLKNRTIFGSLKNTLNSEWYNNNENLVVKTVDETSSYLWQVFSVYTLVTNNDYIRTEFSKEEDYAQFLDLIKSRSFKDFGVELTKDDRILTLSTCYTEEKKLVLHAKMIKKS